MNQKIKFIKLSVESAQELLNYLVSKPYSESAVLINLIQHAEQEFEPIEVKGE